MKTPLSVRGLLVLTLLSALIFRAFPELDLTVAHLFFDRASGSFSPEWSGLTQSVKHGIYRFNEVWIPLLLLTLLVGFLPFQFLKTRLLRWRGFRFPALFLALVLALGPGLAVNLTKESFDRPRPNAIEAFGGTQPFVPAWTTGHGAEGKSFLSGHAAMGFYFVAFAFVVARRYRTLTYGAGLAIGSFISLTRMMAGSHFLSDVVTSALLTLLLIHWLAYHFEKRDVDLTQR